LPRFTQVLLSACRLSTINQCFQALLVSKFIVPCTFHVTLHDVELKPNLHWSNSGQADGSSGWSTEGDWVSCSSGQRPAEIHATERAVNVPDSLANHTLESLVTAALTANNRLESFSSSILESDSFMNKAELIASISEKVQVSQKQIDAIWDATVDTIVEAVSSGDKVVLVGFGSFELKERKSREGRNPKTGEKILIPATKVPGFSAGKAFKEKVKPSA